MPFRALQHPGCTTGMSISGCLGKATWSCCQGEGTVPLQHRQVEEQEITREEMLLLELP